MWEESIEDGVKVTDHRTVGFEAISRQADPARRSMHVGAMSNALFYQSDNLLNVLVGLGSASNSLSREHANLSFDLSTFGDLQLLRPPLFQFGNYRFEL